MISTIPHANDGPEVTSSTIVTRRAVLDDHLDVRKIDVPGGSVLDQERTGDARTGLDADRCTVAGERERECGELVVRPADRAPHVSVEDLARFRSQCEGVFDADPGREVSGRSVVRRRVDHRKTEPQQPRDVDVVRKGSRPRAPARTGLIQPRETGCAERGVVVLPAAAATTAGDGKFLEAPECALAQFEREDCVAALVLEEIAQRGVRFECWPVAGCDGAQRGTRDLGAQRVVAVALDHVGEFGTAGRDDPAVEHDVHAIRRRCNAGCAGSA